MATNYKTVKNFTNFGGLDLESSDILRVSGKATVATNADVRITGALNKRKGYQAKTRSYGGYGSHMYADIDVTTGALTEKMVVLDSNLYVKSTENLKITYSGSDQAYFSVYLSDGDFYLDLYDNHVLVMHQSLGTGVEESSPYTMNALVTAINLISNYAASVTGIDTEPAAFLEVQEYTNLTIGTAYDVPYDVYTIASCPVASPLTTTQSYRADTDFENASFAQLDNVLYVSTGYDELYKYDGQTFYRAGMPTGIIPTSALGASTGITDTNINYKITYQQTDNKGNIIEGILSPASTPDLNPTTQDIDVTVTNIEDTTGFNTNMAVVAGLQSGVHNITVDDGSGGSHNMVVGDKAYFYDGVSAGYVTRNIISVSSTSITVDGLAVNVADNANISNNLRINIWRNTAGGSTYYLIAEIPNASNASTQIYNDTTPTASLGAEYVEPIKPHGLPVKGKYITTFRSQLVIAGKSDDVNSGYYSDIDGPEYFPAGDNSFSVETSSGDKISGICPFKEILFIFKDNSIHALTGDLGTDQFRVDLTSQSVGCSAHHSIKEVQNAVYFLYDNGVYAVNSAANEPENISTAIQRKFKDPHNNFNFKKALAVNWINNNKYVLFMPEESYTKSLEWANTDSRVYAFDYLRGAWFEWNNINASGGLTVIDKKVFFVEKRFDSVADNTVFYTYRIHEQGTTQDYSDHSEPITFLYKTHWEHLGEPSVFKKFLRIKVHALDSSLNDFESDNFILSVETENDFLDSTLTNITLNFKGGAGGWGEFEWGSASWGDTRLYGYKHKLFNSKCKSMRVVFKNSEECKNILISGYELEAVAPYQVDIKE